MKQALAIMAQPRYISTARQELATLVDDILHAAGDGSLDLSWYTQRASLSMIYGSSELFMSNDHSPDFEGTHEFLLRRLDENKVIGQSLTGVGRWICFTAAASVNILRSKGVAI